MPLIYPALSLRNRTPSSTPCGSLFDATSGVAVLSQMLHGHTRYTVTVTPVDGCSMLPLSSVALLRIVIVPTAVGVQVYVQLPVPDAGCHVAPSRETSTAPTTPPPASLAVPLIVMGTPNSITAPGTGDVIVDVGAVVSLDAVALTTPGMRLPGCAPMSAKRLTVACCIATSGVDGPPSWLPSSPHDH